jgi:transcriptional antiterminator RfaH
VRPVNPRARKTRPYFPGYLFVQADLAAVGLVEFRWMPHVELSETLERPPSR